MGAALALVITLVVVVAALSLVVNSHGLPGTERASAPLRPDVGGRQRQRERPHDRSGPLGSADLTTRGPKASRRARSERAERARAGKEEPAAQPDPEQVFGDLRPLNRLAPAVVLSVVDERVLGPVTRCRLTLRVEPEGEESFEVTTRVAFPTPGQRASINVGTRVPVRYDADDHRRVVVEIGGPGRG